MNTTQEILLSELTQAKSYIDRLIHALLELSDGHQQPKIRVACSDLTEELEVIVRDEFMSGDFSQQALIHRENLRDTRRNFRVINTLLETIIVFGGDKKALAVSCTRVINTMYRHAHRIHELLQTHVSLDVQAPRQGFIKEVSFETPEVQKPKEVKKVGPFTLLEGGKVDEIEEDEQAQLVVAPKLYQLDLEEILNSSQSNETSLLGLEGKREEKYELFLASGHSHAYKQDYEQALEDFEKAMSYRECAEIVTLVGWVQSLLGENEKAKNMCMKAISLDPDYGPPYNDLGTVLLNEGQLEESIKWFELAKKAPKYQNKEYPYINAGRAYMMVKNYDKAMIEFEKALSICPENEDLRETVAKIEKSLSKKSNEFDYSTNFSDNYSFNPLEDH